MYDSERSLERGIVSEGAIRNFIQNYKEEDAKNEYMNKFTQLYNDYIEEVKAKLDINPFIHILDVTKTQVNLENENYEKSEVTKDDNGVYRGYKLGTLRGL